MCEGGECGRVEEVGRRTAVLSRVDAGDRGRAGSSRGGRAYGLEYTPGVDWTVCLTVSGEDGAGLVSLWSSPPPTLVLGWFFIFLGMGGGVPSLMSTSIPFSTLAGGFSAPEEVSCLCVWTGATFLAGPTCS